VFLLHYVNANAPVAYDNNDKAMKQSTNDWEIEAIMGVGIDDVHTTCTDPH